MKAKVIDTGEIVNVALVDTNGSVVGQYREIFGARHFHLNQLQFLNEDSIDWEQRRFELVKAAVQGLSAANDERGGWTVEEIKDISINIADAVITKLKEE